MGQSSWDLLLYGAAEAEKRRACPVTRLPIGHARAVGEEWADRSFSARLRPRCANSYTATRVRQNDKTRFDKMTRRGRPPETNSTRPQIRCSSIWAGMAIVLYAHARAYMARSHCRVEARPPNSKAKLKADEGDRYQNQRTAAFTSEILSTQSALSGHPIQFPSCAKRTL